MTLAPAFREYLDQLNPLIAQARASGVEPTPESARAALAALTQYALPLVDVERIEDRVVTYEHGGQAIAVPVRVYVPRPGEPADVVVFVHGGGHMAGDVAVYDFSARRTAAATGSVVVSVDYRRSPEYPFPAGLEDVHAVLLRLDQVVGDLSTTGIVHAVADSGGAAKVSSVAMRVAAGEWSSPITRQVLIYPSLDYTLSGASVAELGTGYFLERDRIDWYFDNYLPTGTDRRAASPVFGPFDAAMPETLVLAAVYDPLLSEAEAYVAGMVAAGARAKLVVAPGMIHAYAFFESLVPAECARTYEVVAEFLRTGSASWDRA